MPVGTDVSCEDMFADESDFEFDVENEGAVASATEAKQAQAVPLTAQAVPLTAHTSKVLGNLHSSVGDPRLFSADPDPRIRTSD